MFSSALHIGTVGRILRVAAKGMDWFQYTDGNAYVVEAINSTSVAALHTALTTTGEVVKILGTVDFASSSFLGHTLSL